MVAVKKGDRIYETPCKWRTYGRTEATAEVYGYPLRNKLRGNNNIINSHDSIAQVKKVIV